MIPEELENNNFYFQYRPISRIIVSESNKSTPKYKDIDRLIESEFYFSPVHKLNDPLDGRPHFYWEANDELWKGLVYHYLITLYCTLMRILLNDDNIASFSVSGYLDNPKLKYNIRNKLNLFFKTEYAIRFIHALSSLKKIDTEMLIMFFNLYIHDKLLEIIVKDFPEDILSKEVISFLEKPILNNKVEDFIINEGEITEEQKEWFEIVVERFTKELDKLIIPDERPFHYIKLKFCQDFFDKFIDDSLSRWGVTSLSQRCDNELMWSHYVLFSRLSAEVSVTLNEV